jgi:hypothetical protein
LRVGVHATDPVRRAGLFSVLAEAGHEVGVAEGSADLLVWDLGPGEKPPLARGSPVVLLSDRPNLERDGRFPAVIARTVVPDALLAAIAAVATGLRVREAGADWPEAGFRSAEEAAGGGLLTPREVDILRAVGEGWSNKEVARRLGISSHTVAKGLRRGVIEL